MDEEASARIDALERRVAELEKDKPRKGVWSRKGLRIVLDDTGGRESILLETSGGQRLRLQDGPGSVRVEDSNGNALSLEPSGVAVTAAGKVTVAASTIEVSAGAVTVNAGMARFSGTIQAATLIANAVVAQSYTPGAGNIW